LFPEIIRIIHDISCSCAILFNTILVIFIATKTPDKLSSYSIIILNFALNESATAAISLFIFNRCVVFSLSVNKSYRAMDAALICTPTGSSRLCFFGSAFLASGHSHVYVLLGYSCCYRLFAITY
ncbi:hypothetical protein PENTCL1PPCAC_4782, partial [Pristionchus entomophagus]